MSDVSKCLPKSPCRRCRKAHSNRNGYCDQHQEFAVGWVARQKAKTTTERGYGHAWRQLRAIILVRDKHCCVPCMNKGFVVAAHAVDHIIPKENGGTDQHSNLQAICKDCHKEKTKGESIKGRKNGSRRGDKKVQGLCLNDRRSSLYFANE